MRHGFFLNEEEFDVALTRSGSAFRLIVGETEFAFQLRQNPDGHFDLISQHEHDNVHAAVDGDIIHVHLNGETYSLRFEHALQRLAEINEAGGADQIRAAMPGSVVSLDVDSGTHVKKGQTLLVMESMKMETTIIAPRDGVVAEIQVAAGQTFDKDAVLLALEPEEEV